MFFRFVTFTFSVSGPFIISFGTYSGLIAFIGMFFDYQVPADKSKVFYTGYLLFLYIAGILTEKESFDAGIKRDPKKESLVKSLKKESRAKSAFVNFLSGGYSLIVEWVLEKKNITFYDVFKKPSHWENFEENHKLYPIFRLQMEDRSLEVRFPKHESGTILVRETLENSHTYGDWRKDELRNWSFLAVFAPWEYLKQKIWA